MMRCKVHPHTPIVTNHRNQRVCVRRTFAAQSSPDGGWSPVATAPHIESQSPVDLPPAALNQPLPIEVDTSGDGGNGGSPPGSRDDPWDGSGGGDPSPGWVPTTIFAGLLRGVRGRLEADPFFGHKLLVECGLDALIILGVNWEARRERFLPEIEFTLCQLAISLLSDFALVYLLAPSTRRSIAQKSTFRAALAGFPSHVFQFTPLGMAPFTLRARAATLLLKGLQYGGVGFCMGMLGAASVQALVFIRERLDGSFEPPATVQSVSGTGAAWGSFMATSSNVRYNLVNGLEDALYRKSVGAGKLGSVALRLLNNYAGAAQWVALTDYLDLDIPWKPLHEEDKDHKIRRRAKKGNK